MPKRILIGTVVSDKTDNFIFADFKSHPSEHFNFSKGLFYVHH